MFLLPDLFETMSTLAGQYLTTCLCICTVTILEVTFKHACRELVIIMEGFYNCQIRTSEIRFHVEEQNKRNSDISCTIHIRCIIQFVGIIHHRIGSMNIMKSIRIYRFFIYRRISRRKLLFDYNSIITTKLYLNNKTNLK